VLHLADQIDRVSQNKNQKKFGKKKKILKSMDKIFRLKPAATLERHI
jgi:hypothetical protein